MLVQTMIGFVLFFALFFGMAFLTDGFTPDCELGRSLRLRKWLCLCKKIIYFHKKGNILPLLKLVSRKDNIRMYLYDYEHMTKAQREDFLLFKYLFYNAKSQSKHKNCTYFERLTNILEEVGTLFFDYKTNMPKEMIEDFQSLTEDEINMFEISDGSKSFLKAQLGYSEKEEVENDQISINKN